MATLTKSTGTVTLSGAAEKVTLPASYGWVWVKNMSEGDIFAGLSADISEGADGVLTIPAGECGRVQTDGFSSVYLLGTGNALVVAQNYADCPFKVGGKGGEIPDLSAYAKKSDIPTALPANGGNADTVDGLHASSFRQITKYETQITTLPTPTSEIDYCVGGGDSTFPYPYGNLSIRYGSYGAEYIAMYYTTGDDRDVWYNVAFSGNWMGWRRLRDGGTASTISEWGTRVFPDLNNAELGFSASCGDAGHLNAPNSFWSTVLTAGSNKAEAFRTQFAFPWSAESNSQKLKYRAMDNGVWSEWKEISTTPIKSTAFSGTTDYNGNIVIWAASERKIPLFAEATDCYCIPAISSTNGRCYMIHVFNSDGDVENIAVSGTVYYIEI